MSPDSSTVDIIYSTVGIKLLPKCYLNASDWLEFNTEFISNDSVTIWIAVDV